MSSISVSTTTFMNDSPRFYFIHICFLSPIGKNVNQIAVNKSKIKHCLIETNSFPIGEFIFILNNDWMGRNNKMSKLINYLYKQN